MYFAQANTYVRSVLSEEQWQTFNYVSTAAIRNINLRIGRNNQTDQTASGREINCETHENGQLFSEACSTLFSFTTGRGILHAYLMHVLEQTSALCNSMSTTSTNNFNCYY